MYRSEEVRLIRKLRWTSMPMRRIWAIAQLRPTDLSQRMLGRRAEPRHKAPAVDSGLLHRNYAWHRIRLHFT